MEKVFIRTFGCQMNVRDSEVVAGLLKDAGYKITDDPKLADIVIFNTCSVRQHAEDKVWSEVGRIAKSVAAKSKIASLALRLARNDTITKPIIGIIGCMAQNYKDSIFQRVAAVDFVVGPSDIAKIPGIIKKLSAKRYPLSAKNLYETKIWETDGENRPEKIYHTGFYEDKEHAFVVISEGCSNFCSYCVVPYVRGPLRNRKPEDIVKEIKEALDKGITKITLLGQNVNSYISSVQRKAHNAGQNSEDINFIELLKLVNDIKGLKEFSFVTSHPKNTSKKLFQVMADLNKLKKYLHMPVQSGSDKILKLMNRGYSRSFYLDLVDNYRRIVRGGALTTDIIVGYPQETEKDFRDTYDLVKDAQFNAAYIFKYSPRPNTAAAKLVDDVPKAEKEKRHKEILELQKKISSDLKKSNIK